MITVIELRQRDDMNPGTWHYEARLDDGRLAYQCEVNARIALARPESEWWASRGNDAIAIHEARKWAEAQVRRMAAAAFTAHVRKVLR